jgi:hypothetical protein
MYFSETFITVMIIVALSMISITIITLLILVASDIRNKKLW